MRNLMKTHHSCVKKQVGATVLGMMFLTATLFLVVFVIIKVFPVYEEYFTIKMVINNINKEPSLNEMSKKDIRESFDKRANVSYITVITGNDITIERNMAGETAVSAQYQVVKPLFGNVSLLLDFNIPVDTN